MSRLTAFIKGLGIGAGAVYLWDPVSGQMRRTWLRDRSLRLVNEVGRQMEAGYHDLDNRARGLYYRIQQSLSLDPISDTRLVQRVRSALGHDFHSMRSVDVSASYGRVTLRGSVLGAALVPILNATSRVPGVKGVTNRLETVAEADIPESLLPNRPELLEPERPLQPGSVLLMGLVGGGILLAGRRRGGLVGALMQASGTAMLASAVKEGATAAAMRSGVDRHNTFYIHQNVLLEADIHTAFQFMRNYLDYPHFISPLRSVVATADGKYHWVLEGPGGLQFEWDALETEVVEDELLAWKSASGSLVRQVGRVRFEADSSNRTLIHMDMSFTPRIDAEERDIAALFGGASAPPFEIDVEELKNRFYSAQRPAGATLQLARRADAS